VDFTRHLTVYHATTELEIVNRLLICVIFYLVVLHSILHNHV